MCIERPKGFFAPAVHTTLLTPTISKLLARGYIMYRPPIRDRPIFKGAAAADYNLFRDKLERAIMRALAGENLRTL